VLIVKSVAVIVTSPPLRGLVTAVRKHGAGNSLEDEKKVY
jgi:hypothetical protein